MNRQKSKVIVKKNIAIYYTDLKNIYSGNPLPYFNDKGFEKMTDMVLSQKENLLIYLTSRGVVGMIELEKSKKSTPVRLSSLIGEKSEDGHSKDSTDSNGSRYYSLRITPDDDYLAAVSTEKVEGGLSFSITILKLNHQSAESTEFAFPTLQYTDRRQLVDERVITTQIDQRIQECIPQYVNFSIKNKSRSTNILLVFIRSYPKFFIFPVIQGKIGEEQAVDMFPTPSAIDSGLLVDDGCMIDDTILVTLQSHMLLKITFSVN